MTNPRQLELPKEEESEVESDFISGYEGVVKRIVADTVREVGDFSLDFDDLYQEGMIALFHASKKYENTGQAAFVTYAYKAVKNRVIKEAKRYAEIYSYEFSYSENPKKYEKAFSSDEEFDYEPVVKAFIRKLNYKDQMIFQLYLEGKSYSEIAVMTSTSNKKVDNRLCLIRKKLNDFYKSKQRDEEE